MKKILSFIIFLSFSFSYSQKSICELGKEIVIPFVEIYSRNGYLIGVTDKDGVISQNLEEKINASNTHVVTFSHHFFENKEVPIRDFFKFKLFFLKRTVIELDEVIVKKQKNIKYLKLKGYFRSVQMNENKPHYFNDGIVNYYISLKTGKIKTKVVYNRTFEDKHVKQLSTSYHFSIVGVPLFNDLFIKKNLLKKYTLIKESEKTENIALDNKTKGYLNTNEDNFELQLSINSKEDSKKMKLFGMESELDVYNISAIYDKSAKSAFDLKNILFFKEIRSYNLRKNKKENFSKIDSTHEFLLLEKEYVEKIDVSGFDNNYSFISPSKYDHTFWKEIDNKLFQPYPNSLNKAILEMIEIK